MTSKLNVISLNCNGLGDKYKRKRLFRHFTRRNVDIVLLQETHSSIDTSPTYADEWKRMSPNHHSYWNSGTSRSCGVAILIANKRTTKVIDTAQDPNGRVFTVQAKIKKLTFQFQSIYAPNTPESRPSFFESLKDYLFPDGEVILGGDFNMVEDLNVDRVGGTVRPSHLKGKPELDDMKRNYSLVDQWRSISLQVREYTWSKPDRTIHSRLDRFYISSFFTPYFINQTHLSNPWSDHKMVNLNIQMPSAFSRGNGYWKLNTSLLKDQEYIQLVESFLRRWIDKLPEYNCIQLWWIDCKVWVKKISIDHASQKNRLRNQKIKALKSFVSQENRKSFPDTQYIIDTEEKISDLEENRHRGAMIRSRERTIIDGEKPTRYFYAHEKLSKAKSTITELITNRPNDNANNPNDGYDTDDSCDEIINNIYHNDNSTDNDNLIDYNPELINTENDILNEIQSFYQDLYSKQDLDTNLQDQLLANIDRTLPPNVRTMMDRQISAQELFRGMNLFKRNKSPGIDGLPIEFYITFWHILSDTFLTLINNIYNNGLSPTAQQRISLIALIHKKNEKEFLDNWRPISLLCVDFKMLSKVLSMRLKEAQPHIVHPDQTCGILGRSIFENLYTIRDIITYAGDHKIPAYIVSLDFQKAFDKVDHNFLVKTLQAFGFGAKYTNYISSSNRNCTARVMNNGRFTADIQLERGIKQGDQESSQLYCLIAEVLAVQIRKNQNIKGLHIPGDAEELKMCLYADDNNSIVTSEHSIVQLLHELERFREASGCNINQAKTVGMTIGGAFLPDIPLPIRWNPSEGMVILGITFFQDSVATMNATWNKIISKMKTRVEQMSSRALSLRGRGILLNTIILSKAWHAATVIPANKTICQTIARIAYAYLFKNKLPHKPAEEVLTFLLKDGGVNAKDFSFQQQSLRLNRLRLTLDETQTAHWVRLTRLYTAAQIIRHNADWPFLTTDAVPKIDFQLPEFRTLRVQICHQELCNFLRDHKRAFLNLFQLKQGPTTRTIYGIFLKHRHATTPIYSQRYWNAATDRELPWKHIWQTTYQSLDRSHYLDTYYKFLHNAHPTGETVDQSNRNYVTHCKRCHRYETTLHTFMECPFARNVWNRYHYAYASLVGTQALSYGDVLFSTMLPANRHQRLLVLTLTNVIMHELWRARCQQQKNGVPTNVNTSTAVINSKLKSIHLAYFHQAPNYVTKLCLPSVLCQEDGTSLRFNLPKLTDDHLGIDSDLTSDEYVTVTASDTTGSESS